MLLVATVTVLVSACAGTTGTAVKGRGERIDTQDRAATAAAVTLTDLAVELEHRLAADDPDADAAIAPLPVASGLAQAQAGARNDTAAELERLLPVTGPTGLPTDVGLASLDQILTGRSGEEEDASGRAGKISVELAQTLWLQKGTEIEQPWLDRLATTWGVETRTTDFRSDSETARRAVNTWLSDATNGHLEQLLRRGDIGGSTRLLAASGAYLKAPWLTPFAEVDTRLAPFHQIDGRTTTVSMMRNADLDEVRYGRGDGWEAVDLPYLGRDLWLTVVLPDSGRFRAVEEGLDGAGLTALVESLTPSLVDLSLPKFGFTTTVDLDRALRALGLELALDPDRADFSGISAEHLSLTGVPHQTFLAADEQGTEAVGTGPDPTTTTTTATSTSTTAPAGATSTTVSGVDVGRAPPVTATSSPVRSVVVDRPFLVLVRDRSTGAPVFYGRVVAPGR